MCYQCANNQQPDLSTYFAACPTAADGSRRSVSRSGSTDMDNHISDFDSESSKDTVNEKHTHEDKEKEKEEAGDMEEKSEDSSGQREKDNISAVSRKRKTSDSRKLSPDLSSVNEAPGEDMPRKKRPMSSGSNILDDSIHMPDSNGINIQELLSKVNSFKRKGLFQEYGSVKMEAPSGTFNTSK